MVSTGATKTPTISALMPVYNSARYVRLAIESILAQTYPDFELLALDDGSCDGSFSILNEYASRDTRISIWSRPNRGVVITRNELVDNARGKYLALLDSDDVCRPDRFEKQIKYLDSDPVCVAVGARSLLIDPAGMPIMESKNPLSHEEIERNHFLLFESQMCNSSVMLVRDSVRTVGKYRDGFESAEDFDLLLRLGEVGTLANLPDVLVEYRHHLRSICYRDTSELRRNARKAVQDALHRRGLIMDTSVAFEHSSKPETVSDVHRKWAWWALSAGNIQTSRKHAMLALIGRPFSLNNLRAAACSLRGY